MNAPQIEAQSKIRGAFQQILELKEGWEMRMTKGMKQTAAWIHDGLATTTKANIVRGLASGILLMAATGMYFGVTFGGTSEATSTHEVDSEYRFTDLDDPDDHLSVQDLLTYVYPEEAGQVKATGEYDDNLVFNGTRWEIAVSEVGIDSEYRFTDLDDPDDHLSVQDLLTYVYPEEAGQVK